MAPSFFAKLGRQNPTASRPSPPSDPAVLSATPPYSPAAPAHAPDGDSSPRSVTIGVVPPSPRAKRTPLHKPSDLALAASSHADAATHRRTRSHDRLDRHAVSLAAYSQTERPISNESLVVPVPVPVPVPHDLASPRRASSPAPSSRQLSPASSTGNLKDLITKHASRSDPDDLEHSAKLSAPSHLHPANPSERLTADPRHEVHIHPPSATSPHNTASRDLLSVHSDGDAASLQSAVSSDSKKKKNKPGSPWTLTSPSRKQPANPSSRSPASVPRTPSSAPHRSETAPPSVVHTRHMASSSVHSVPVGDDPTRLPIHEADLSERTSFDSSDEGSEPVDKSIIPVTGFAVASNKRNADFHELFSSIPEGDYLIEDYGCALQREILIQGRIYISENHLCFHANIFGWITDLSVPICEVVALEKKMTAFVIPNAIQVTTRQAKYTFASFLSRDTTFDVIDNIWRLVLPPGSRSIDSADNLTSSSRDVPSPPSLPDDPVKTALPPLSTAVKVTHCSCSEDGSHFSEVALETVLAGAPDKIYNLMFASGFIKDFMRVDQKLTDIQISDWSPVAPGSKLLSRNMSYIKPLNNSVGPKQTKCEIHDETVYCDFDDHAVMVTSTRTPDVPSGGVFVVKTRTCIMWASTISTRVIVTTQVEWTGRSFIKSLIERSAIDGQRSYHSDLDKAMRMYIQEHQSEFIPEGIDPCAVAPVEPITPIAENVGPGLDFGVSDEEVRKARERDRNRRGLQWAYDTLDGTYNVARRSTLGALELVREAWEQSSATTIMWFVIVILVFSNLWTLSLMGRREEAGRRKEAKKVEERERWVQEVVHSIWEEMSAGRTTTTTTTVEGGGLVQGLSAGPLDGWRAEIAGIRRTLDAVEDRVRTIEESISALD